MLTHDRTQPLAQRLEPTKGEPVRLQLANGLLVRLLHLPNARRASAFIRVAAGSHDAPLQYPGLAHFLEHLVFLGSTGFSAQDGLLAYVRACAGEVNASTRERHTDYFFEAPANKLEDGLARLCDMLARPLFDVAAQLREREVVHAEFVARGQDRNTLVDTAIGQALAYGHPCSGFHAGNRDTLKVEHAAFQVALEDFHQRFYQAGQLQLVLAGPQPLSQLRQLAEQHAGVLRAAPALLQSAAPALLPLRCEALQLQVPAGTAQLSLCFALQGLPAGYPQAVDFLQTWLCHEVEDGLLDTLRSRGWCDAVQVRQVYQHGDQALLSIDFQLSDTANAHNRASIRAALFDWLSFFSDQDDWQPWREEYGRIAQQHLGRASPLQLARYWSDRPLADGQLDSQTLWALRKLLSQLQPGNLLELFSSTAPVPVQRQLGFTLHLQEQPRQPAAVEYWNWHLPGANPLLQPSSPVVQPLHSAAIAGLTCLPGPQSPGQEQDAAFYVRWSFTQAPPHGLFEVLQVALRAQLQLAEQAGVQVRFEQQGSGWQLQLNGRPDVFAPLLANLTHVLVHPPNLAWGQGMRLHRELALRAANEPLVRQLWQRLPELFQAPQVDGYKLLPTPNALALCWAEARYQALAVGVPDALRGQLQQQFAALPGQGHAPKEAPVVAQQGRFWLQSPNSGDEAALVLFYLLPDHLPSTEVAWRLLGQWLESPFFQRLRSELQVGYAVFCGYRQIAGRPGLLFAVQSPNASVAQIAEHIDAFLLAQRERIATLDHEQLQQLRLNLAEYLRNQASCCAAIADLIWASQQSARPLIAAEDLEAIEPDGLRVHFQLLLEAAGGVYGAGNAPSPGGTWNTQSTE
ncbi:pyrroloquinoline quinone biosynthesis protein PqqF [Pseudomonas turukhanskensis]|uniref:Coenzyme PQQ synthesis protein F n=1 Tax=Pseudomonas turukhanskensis TaxID=1806536 RepID=A0A9W6NIG1_9PSED|nr:pyrroloquinoline quinone biosynthesis protein PqqF [Pseudomonas turukhanskensis]GLK91781.1 coenzyme PQQ synthesis protein F [Pseudomonas turukhanskensis]